jgi:hypothetical protein
MKPDVILEHLEAAAAAAGVKVSIEQISATVGNGGLCRVKGEYRVIIDKRATPGERVAILAAALAVAVPADQLEALPEKIRETIETYAPRAISRSPDGSRRAS